MRRLRNYAAGTASQRVEHAAWLLDQAIEILDSEDLLSDWHRSRLASIAVDAHAWARIQSVMVDQRRRQRRKRLHHVRIIELAQGNVVMATTA